MAYSGVRTRPEIGGRNTKAKSNRVLYSQTKVASPTTVIMLEQIQNRRQLSDS